MHLELSDGEHVGDDGGKLGEGEGIAADPIASLYAVAERVGYGPQRHQLMGCVLAGISAAAGYSLNLLIAGDPSGGKSYTAQGALKILGPDWVASSGAIQKLTPAAMSRMNGQLTGRCVFLDERHRGNDEFESLLRQAASGQRATRIVTIKGEPTEFTVEPPVAIVDLALADRPASFQDRSRQLRLRMHSDEATRETITNHLLRRFTLEGISESKSLESFARSFQVFLAGLAQDLAVVVPFAESLRIDSRSRLRDRLLNNVLSATCVVAWLRQHMRRRIHNGRGEQCIVAEVEDYRAVFEILIACGDDGSDEISDNGLRLFRIWKKWAETHGNCPLRRSAFVEVTEDALSIWPTYRALRELAEFGYAVGPQGRGSVGYWQLTDLGLATERPNLFAALPGPEQIEAQFCKAPTEHRLSAESTKNCSLAGDNENGPM